MKRLALLIFWLLFPATAQAITYYAAPTGGQTSSCVNARSVATPATPAFALGCMVGGDRLELRGGDYSPAAQFPNPPSGTAGAHTVIASYQNETVNFRLVAGGGTTVIWNFYNGNFQYVDFVGGCTTGTSRTCRMNWMGTGTTSSDRQSGLQFSGSTPAHNIVFDGVRVTGWGNHSVSGESPDVGISLGLGGVAAANITYKNGRVDNNGKNTTLEGPGYAFYIGNSQNFILENTEIDNNGGSGIQQFSGTSTGNSFKFNIFHDNGVTPNPSQAVYGLLTGGGCTNTIVAFNLIYGSGHQYGLSDSYGCNGTKIYNNTVYGASVSGISINTAGTGSTGAVVTNNISSNSNGISNTGTSTTFTQNLCSSAGTNCAYSETASSTFNTPGSDFTLKTSPQSLAINNGTPGIAIGITIPACTVTIVIGCYNGTAPDIGALESGAPAAGGPPVLTATPPTVAAGAAISVTVDDDDVNERTESVIDWVGTYVPGAVSYDALDWFYMNGSKTAPTTAISDAVIAFTAPATPGNYEFRFYANGSASEVDRLATVAFTVTTPGIVMKLNLSSLKIGPGVTMKIGVP